MTNIQSISFCKRSGWNSWAVAVALATLAGIYGCDQKAAVTRSRVAANPSASGESSTDQHGEHDHDHDDDHDHEHGDHAGHHDHHQDEHGIPRHKPSSFAACVKSINGSGHELLHHAENEQAVLQFRDYLRWLPEFAADTDLSKQDWEEVVRVAQDLDRWFPAEGKPGSHRDFDQLVARLRKYVTLAQSLRRSTTG